MRNKPESASRAGQRISAVDEAAAGWISRRDAGLTLSEEAELKAWLEADPSHGTAFSRYDASWRALDRPHLGGDADTLLHEVELRIRRRRRRTIGTAGVLAAVLALGAVWQFRPSAPEPERSASADAVFLLPSRHVLPDGSIIENKTGAEIRVAFTPTVRRVELLRGEALFHVKKDSVHPFVVQAGGVDVRAVGTAFSVQLDRADVAVLVTEGQVAVYRTAPSAAPAPLAAAKAALPAQAPSPDPHTLALVSAGKRIVVPIQAPAAQGAAMAPATPVTDSEVDELLAWRASRVEFSGMPLSKAIALLNRYSSESQHVTFVIADPSIATIRVSGLFRLDKTDALVQLLKNGFGIDATDSGDGRILLRKVRP